MPQGTQDPFPVGTVVNIEEPGKDVESFEIVGRYRFEEQEYAQLCPTIDYRLLARIGEDGNLEGMHDPVEVERIGDLITAAELDEEASLEAATLTLDAFEHLAREKWEDFHACFPHLHEEDADSPRHEPGRTTGAIIAKRHIPDPWLQVVKVLGEGGYGVTNLPEIGDARYHVPLEVWELAMATYASHGGV